MRKLLTCSFLLYASVLSAQPTPARLTAILGAGKAGTWDTEISVTNVERLANLPVVVTAQYRITLECLYPPCNDYASATIPPSGSFDLPAIPNPPDPRFSNQPQVIYVLSPQGLAAPAVTAIATDTASSCGRGDTLPVVAFEKAFELPDLVFSGARRDSTHHVNLFVAADPFFQASLPITIHATDGGGVPEGNPALLDIPFGASVLLVDVLEQLGVTSLESGSLRITWTPPTFLSPQAFAATMTIVEPDRLTVVAGKRVGED